MYDTVDVLWILGVTAVVIIAADIVIDWLFLKPRPPMTWDELDAEEQRNRVNLERALSNEPKPRPAKTVYDFRPEQKRGN